MPFPTVPDRLDFLTGPLRRLGLPLTKAGYLRWMFEPGDPSFPLHAEVLSAIPKELPGRIPTSVLDMIRLTRFDAPDSPQPSAQPAPSPTVR